MVGVYDTRGDAQQAYDRAAIGQVGIEADTFFSRALSKAEAPEVRGKALKRLFNKLASWEAKSQLHVSSCVWAHVLCDADVPRERL